MLSYGDISDGDGLQGFTILHLGPYLVSFGIEKWSIFGHWWYYHIFIISIDRLKEEMRIYAIKST